MRRSTTQLDIGAGPAGDADAVGIRAGTLPQGAEVWVLDEAADRSWALVAAVDGPREADMLLGWVPLSVDGASSLEPVPLACPEPALGVEALADLGRLGGLACYGDERIELVGFTPTACGAGGSPRSGTPDWLNGTWTAIGIGASEPVPPDFEVPVQVLARVAPDAAFEAGCGAPGWFRFVGQFDHPAAETCRTTLDEGAGPVVIEPRISTLLCRAQLVLSEAHRLARAP